MATITEALQQAWKIHQSGDVRQAEQIYRNVLAQAPDSAAAWCYLGIALHDLRRLEESAAAYQQALALQPDFAVAHNNFGNTLGELGKLDEALLSFDRALALKPDYWNAYSNRAAVLVKQGRAAEAEAGFRDALNGMPEISLVDSDDHSRQPPISAAYAGTRKNLAVVCLMQGKFEEGWREFEWRFKTREARVPQLPQPRWDGSPLDGKILLLCAEQGLGDTVHFIRYAPLLQQRGAMVMAAVQKPLLPIMKGCAGIDRLVPLDAIPADFDLYTPLMSVPRLLDTTLQDIPAEIPYLQADAALIQRWGQALAPPAGFQVAIAWRGSHSYADDRFRSIPLEHFEVLSEIPGVELISLQTGADEEIRNVPSPFPLTCLAGLDKSAGPFMDTAAIMKNVDLVITADTVIGHLAGALGVPVWIALGIPHDWRWLLGREDSPWYPTARLFRQQRPGDWANVFQRMAGVLRSKVEATAKVSLRVEIAPGELIDKMTILQIKLERLTAPTQLASVRAELAALEPLYDSLMVGSAALHDLARTLREVNQLLWDIEDEIRGCERDKDFGSRFIELARSVYRTNDERAAIKGQINELLGAKFMEAKSYTEYR